MSAGVSSIASPSGTRRHWVRFGGYACLWVVLLAILWLRRAPHPEIGPIQLGEMPADFRIYVNSDSWERIALIDGIGEALARKIVRAREERGAFRSLDEVKQVPGVPDRRIDDARAYLTLTPREP
jgi:hypothetical protein